MKFHELPEIAQNAACEVIKNNIGRFIGSVSGNEPALELARTVNAVFTELYSPTKSASFQSDNVQKEE